MRKELSCKTPDSVFLLPNTGFSVDSQITLNIASFENRHSIEQFQTEIIEKNKEDLVSFYWEYLKKEPVLPIPLSISESGDIICPRYGNAKLYETVSEKERGGSVKKNIEKLNEVLPLSSDGTSFVFTSAPGWSGYDGISYPDTQTYFYQKTGNSISAMTVVTSMTLEQNKQLIEKLTGTTFKDEQETETLTKTTGTLMSFSSLSVHELINEIEGITKKDLEHIHQAADTNPVIDDVISNILYNFEIFVQQNIFDMSEASQKLLKQEMGRVVLQMQNVTARGVLPQTNSDYTKSLSEVQEIGGCNGGGYMETPFGPRAVEYDFSIWGVCVFARCSNPEKQKWLGPCHICEHCDTLIRSGDTTPGKIVSKNNEVTSSRIVTDEDYPVISLIPIALVAVLSGLFSRN